VLAWGLHLRVMPRRARPVLAAVVLAALAAPADALTRRELGCQAAIARAGRVYVERELAHHARCWISAVQGKPCGGEEEEVDPAERNEKYVRRLLRKCRGVTLARLGGGGCVARSADAAALADCVVETHAEAVATLLSAQFGFVRTPLAVPCASPQHDDGRSP
jgi:hypothetical protein